MTIAEALISGLVQGVTEFLPISSSGHLVFVHKFFGFTEPSVFFDICLHVATLAAVVLYFWRDIFLLVREKNVKWLLYIIIGSVPAVLAGLFLEEKILIFFTSPRRVAYMLLVTSLVLFTGHFAQRMRDYLGKGPDFLRSFLVGLAQAFALLPGISRSGMTISSGIASGMKWEEAFRFSFLLSVPVIAGAALYKALTLDKGALGSISFVNYASGMLVAFIAGLVSLVLLRKVLRVKGLFIFGAYCLILGTVGIFLWK